MIFNAKNRPRLVIYFLVEREFVFTCFITISIQGLTKVWCTTESGGIKRTWSGYPRLVYNPNNKVESCACVNEPDLNHPSVKTYSNCLTSTICKF